MLHINISFKQGDFLLKAEVNIPLNGIVAITGPSGSGKSSLLKCIAGLKKDPDGIIKFNDIYWQNSKKNTFLETHKRKIGFIFQDENLFPHMNVLQNIIYAEKRKHNKSKEISREFIIEKLNISHLLNKKPHHLSGGEKQKVAIARTLANSPNLILMDEPLSSIDEEGKMDIIKFLNDSKNSISIPMIFVTHSEMEKNYLAEHHFIMRKGIISPL